MKSGSTVVGSVSSLLELASFFNSPKCPMLAGKAVIRSTVLVLLPAGTVIVSPSLGLVMSLRGEVGINKGALDSVILPLPLPRALFRLGGTSEALTPRGIDTSTSSRWRISARLEEDDLDRCHDRLPALDVFVGSLDGGGVFGIATSKPTLGSELAEGAEATESVGVPATVVVVPVELSALGS